MTAPTNGRSAAIWKMIASAMIAANVTGVGAWLAFGRSAVTKQEMIYAINNAPYPWKEYERVVLAHMAPGNSIHENDAQKRVRIREEIGNSLIPLQTEVRSIHRDIDEIKDLLERLMP